MTVYFVGAGPGDPDLLTRKAYGLLQECRFCIYAGSLVSPEVIGLIPQKAERHDSAQLTLEEICALLQQAHSRGLDAIRLHTGDPTVFSAIAEQMDLLEQMNIDYEVVPGVSSFQAAACALKVELTVPEVSQAVVLSRVAGRTPVPDKHSLEQLGRTGATLCLFLSVQKIAEVTSELTPFYGSQCPAAVVYRAGWPQQQIVFGNLGDLAMRVVAKKIDRTAMIIVGQALARRGPNSRLYDSGFTHGYRRANP